MLSRFATFRSDWRESGVIFKLIYMKDPTTYSNYGQIMTGFVTGNEQSLFGHWSNPEYAQLMQESELVSGTCCRCGERWEYDFWTDDTKTICLNCDYEPTSNTGGTLSDLPF